MTRIFSPAAVTKTPKPQFAIDWSLEDRSLLALRGRTLAPMQEGQQQWWECLNYRLGVLGLAAV